MGKKTEDSYEKVKKYVRQQKMICDNDVVFVGLSGGADSVCLLLMLCKLSKEIDFNLIAVHVHHGIREDADEDAYYAEMLCKRLNIPFFIRRVDMAGYAKEMGLSPEEAGRRLRYEAFEEVIEEVRGKGAAYREDESAKISAISKMGEADLDSNAVCKIAVAHNRNDKAETMLFNLFRGSGLRGLGSIRPIRGNIIRPILCLERREIESYLKQNKISFCIDSTNEDDTYTRNKIRHHIIPFAKEQICKNSVEHISDAADILAETEVYIQKQTKIAYEKCTRSNKNDIYEERIGRKKLSTNEFKSAEADMEHKEESVVLDLKVFLAQDSFLQKMILLYCMEILTPHRKDITKEHIVSLLELCSKKGCKEISLPYGIMAYKEYDKLVICKKRKQNVDDIRDSEEYRPIPFSIPGYASVPGLGRLEFKYLKEDEFFYKKGQIIPEKTYTKWFDCDKITEVLELRTRKMGDYLTINDALKKKTVKEYMINEKIPQTKREGIYMLADGAHILWIPGYRISQYYKVDENTKHILQVHLEEDDNG